MYFYYYLYGVERVGLASGYRTFGGRDWFREGAAAIINRLCERDPDTGRVTVRRRIRGRGGSPVQVRQLAFGLMFLSRGRVPVAVNKLRADDIAWNNRPRDAANLARWLSRETEGAVNWQIVTLDGEPQDWLQAPMLYLASHERLPWTPGDETLGVPLQKLKRYLDLGGLLFAVNEGDGKAFGQSLQRAGSRMYPQHRWRALPPDHWAYTLLWPVRGRRPALRGLSNGLRDLIILSPARDLSATLQTRDEDQPEFATAANIYLYASEMNRPRPRLASPPLAAGAQEGEGRAAALIVRASYDGNWKPEPLALGAFAAAMAAGRGLDIRIADEPLAAIDALDPRPDLVIVSGIDALEFSTRQRLAVRAYVDAGGVILFETPGGRGPFTHAAEQMCREIFHEAAGAQALLQTRIITGEGLPGAERLSRVEYRPFALDAFGARETTPRLRGLSIEGQPRVLFSRQDISNALLDQPCWGIVGYTAESARALLGNILQHAVASSD
jgi:hypothetical protein